MIQLSDRSSPIDSRAGRPGDREVSEEIQNGAKVGPVDDCDASEADGLPLFVSPPPAPWPRIFPSL